MLQFRSLMEFEGDGTGFPGGQDDGAGWGAEPPAIPGTLPRIRFCIHSFPFRYKPLLV